ncbi:MAG: hypothetical protein QNI84_13070 [Henriciella sp.]|nr:hypothetical protein [Henriciella sp.]
MNTPEQKLTWVAPKLEKLSVEKTLTGSTPFAFEIFNASNQPVGGPTTS